MQTNNNPEIEKNSKKLKPATIDNKWKKKLHDYKNYLKAFIKHYKKAQKGNDESQAIYPYMRLKWETLNEQLNNATTKQLLTEKQIKKVKKIQTKIINACIE